MDITGNLRLTFLLCGVLCILFQTSVAKRRRSHESRSQEKRDVSIDETIENEALKETLEELEFKLNTKVHAVEHKLSWKINDRINKVNHSIEIAYLDRMLHLVNEELTMSLERGEVQRRTVQHLENIITTQSQMLTTFQEKLVQLETQLQKLTLSLSTSTKADSTVSDIQNRINPNGDGSMTSDIYFRPLPETADMYFSDFPQDCQAAYLRGDVTGIGAHFTHIQPWLSRTPFEVRCELSQDNQGWTVIQRRVDGSVDFFRGWREYRNGFGTFRGEFWLGLQRIYEITNQGDYKLRIEMTDWEGNDYWAEYEHLRIEDEENHYRLHVHGYTGTAGDSLTSPWENHSGQSFSTHDNDHDGRFYDNCALYFRGAWWFTSCFESHLNGKYYHKGEHNDFFNRNGIQWNAIHQHSSLRAVQMMVMPHAKPYIEPAFTTETSDRPFLNAVP